MEYVSSPNLPQGKVLVAAVSEQNQQIISALKQQGIKCIKVTQHGGLAEPVQTHADMLLHHLGGKQILAADKDAPYVEQLKLLGFEVSVLSQSLHKTYPGDVALNAARIGRTLFCRKDTAPEIVDYCAPNGIAVNFVNQGYARCSVAIASPYAVITADSSIAKACETSGIEVLLIQPGFIKLPGYPYGFIGGCCGLIEKDVLAFTGNIFSHPNGKKIADFLTQRSVKYVCLTECELLDIGGILPLMCRHKDTF
ncbi:DUF6873 family GME fold protein [Acetanaerobacterium elongatum]|uniref:DUF6873 domain-containing protein n=1 Tax=Acetanaerobacterium elongatum TaxID=258515 RepID=A0A1H0BE69_9FIRM|nr:hypothetical protein [Acetanaerobacterium elongatum]SDN43723.1 hypothetical protein SAMN05192585_11937 [Acetanaerobacterium elongatum]